MTLRRATRTSVFWAYPFTFLLTVLVVTLVLTTFLSALPASSNPPSAEPKFEMTLSGAIGSIITLTSEETTRALSCSSREIRFALPATELYGLSWAFTLESSSRPSIYTLSSTYPLRLNLLGQAGAYRTFTANEGELSFDPESKRGHFTAFLYDDNGERVFASAAWQCE